MFENAPFVFFLHALTVQNVQFVGHFCAKHVVQTQLTFFCHYVTFIFILFCHITFICILFYHYFTFILFCHYVTFIFIMWDGVKVWFDVVLFFHHLRNRD